MGNDDLVSAMVSVRNELANITGSLAELNTTLPSLRSEVDEKVTYALEQAEVAVNEAVRVEDNIKKYQRKLTGTLLIPIVVIIIFAGLILWSTIETRRLADRTNDCTQPTGQCFQENRKTFKESIESINNNTSNQIKASLERNHQDHESTDYLFCDALRNAELPVPGGCDETLAQGAPTNPAK